MKISKTISLFASVLLLASCMTQATYFGDHYPATTTIQTFYSAKDVGRPYKVIGHLNATVSNMEIQNDGVKEKLIAKAKQVGADALIMSELVRESHRSSTDDLSVKAEVIIFTDKAR